MLAASRFCFLLTLLLAFPLLVFVLAASLPSAAQVQGVPPSVPSSGSWGSTMPTPSGLWGSKMPTPGVNAGVTSPGLNGYFSGSFLGNCCANFFWPSGFSAFDPNPPLAPKRHRHRHDDDQTSVPVAVPAYIPYGVPYAADADDDAADSQDASDPVSGGSRPGNRQVTAKGSPGKDSGRDSDRDSGYDSGTDSAPAEAAPEKVEEPIAVQPTTVLVFKDGHRSEVVNYAIVGDTLFNFADGRAHKILLADLDLAATRKANDDLGVDFKLPPAGK